MLKTKIKACAVTNLTDARYFAAREVEWLGFRLDGDPTNGISLLAAKAIAEWVDGVKIVGEFDFVTADEIREVATHLHFDAVQVGMFTPVHELEQLEGVSIIQEVVVEKGTTEARLLSFFRERAHCCTYFLLDFSKAGIDWALIKAGKLLSIGFLQRLFAEHKTILMLDFEADEVQDILVSLQPEGIGLAGGNEEKIGFKSFDELDTILDHLEIAA